MPGTVPGHEEREVAVASNCPKCGSAMVRFENPDREICPTPERHNISSNAGKTYAKGNKGNKNAKGNQGGKKK